MSVAVFGVQNLWSSMRTILQNMKHVARAEIWRARLNLKLRMNPPVFVFQMGKVASRSVTEPLPKYYRGAVIHDHVFCGERMERMQGETRELYRYVKGRHAPKTLHMISLVREPLARNISAFFNNFELHTGVSPSDWRGGLDELKDCFLRSFPHDQPLFWFEQSIESNFGIDVYSVPFPAIGSVVLEREPYRLLVIRMEENDSNKSQAVREFLSLPSSYSVTRANERSSKDGALLYRRFVEWVRFDVEFVDFFCRSRYFQHFYDASFIEKTRRRWTEGIPAQ